MTWHYMGGDAGIALFDAALRDGAPMAFTPGMRILEVGCNESDWLERARDTWKGTEFLGIDSRAKPERALRADAMNPDVFAPESFDAVVSLSAIEHIGLGHYGDPKDPDGDTKAVANIWRWLKPGGFIYFDVPYNPTGYSVLNTECRIYDDDALWTRLWQVPLTMAKGRAQQQWIGYVDSMAPGTLIEKPTVKAKRYYYAASVWKKAG